GPEYCPALPTKPIGKAQRQRDLGTDDDEVDGVRIRRIDQAVDVVGGNVEVGRHGRGAGISRGDVDPVLRIIGGEGLGERVLPAAATDDEQSHTLPFVRASWNASRARSVARFAAVFSWSANSLNSLL